METDDAYRAGRLPYCDAETPHLITDVTITPATPSDFAVLPTIQAHLATRQLTPGAQ